MKENPKAEGFQFGDLSPQEREVLEKYVHVYIIREKRVPEKGQNQPKDRERSSQEPSECQ